MNKKQIFQLSVALVSLWLFFELLTHTSPAPLVFNRYSLGYLVLLCLVVPLILLVNFLVYRYQFRAIRILLKNTIAILGILVVIEILGQFYAWFHPSYDVLTLEPNNKLGWTLPPNLEFHYTGNEWYAREYSALNRINSLGFRDLERSEEKEEGVIRVGVLGASMITSKENSFEDTVPQILEKKLNDHFGRKNSKRFEVLNFGGDAYGMGQPLIVYSEIARKFNLDFVVFYVADELHFWKTVGSGVCWALNDVVGEVLSLEGEKKKVCYDVRPVFYIPENSFAELDAIFSLKLFQDFLIQVGKMKKQSTSFTWEEYNRVIKEQTEAIRLEDVQRIVQKMKSIGLTLYPPKDFEQFKKDRDEVIKNLYAGGKVAKRKTKLFLHTKFSEIKTAFKVAQNQSRKREMVTKGLLTKYAPDNPNMPGLGNKNYPKFEHVIFANLKILSLLNDLVEADNTKFGIADAVPFLTDGRLLKLPSFIVSDILQKFSKIYNIGYMPVGESLNERKKVGEVLQWKYDPHLNKKANMVIAEGMFQWVKKEIEGKK